ncbi:MAG: SseB family protein [Nocardioidaceae bacterium]
MQSLPDPGFAGDTGQADPVVREALAAYSRDRVEAPVLAALCRSRLLVPVVTLATQLGQPESGLAHEKRADVAAVLMQRADGRKALLAFTSLTTLQAWDAKARPVPVSTVDAARSAEQAGASAVIVDAAGPVRFAIQTPALQRLAAGQRLAETSGGYFWLATAR